MTRFTVGVAATIVLLAGCGDATESGSTDESAKPTTTRPAHSTAAADSTSSPGLKAVPAGDAPLEPGTYRIPESAWSVADFTVTFAPHWSVQYGHVFHKNEETDTEIGFYAVVVEEIFSDSCAHDFVPVKIGPSVKDLVNALREQPGPAASAPVSTTLGGYPATRVDLTVPEGLDLATCRFEDVGLQVWYSRPADKHLVVLADGITSVYILDINGQRQVVLVERRTANSEQDLKELQTVLDSIRIEV